MNKKFKKNKKLYKKNGQQSDSCLQEVMSGFLITCDKNRSREAIKEGYQLIEQYVEVLYPEEAEKYEQILEQNIDNLKSQKQKFTKMLYNFDTKVNCVVFIKLNRKDFPNIDVDEVSKAILFDVYEKSSQVSRYCYRMVPVQAVCRATMEELKKNIAPLIEKYFPLDRPHSWYLMFKSRYTDKLSKFDVIKTINSIMEPLHYQEWKDPEYTIFVEVNGAILYLNVLTNYQRYKEYSIRKGGQFQTLVEEKVGLQQKVFKKAKLEGRLQEQQPNEIPEVDEFQQEAFLEEQEIDLL